MRPRELKKRNTITHRLLTCNIDFNEPYVPQYGLEIMKTMFTKEKQTVDLQNIPEAEEKQRNKKNRVEFMGRLE